MRCDPEDFGDDEVELIQMSRRLREAQDVEAILTEAGIEYAVQAEKYTARLLMIFPTERIGAFFYVRPEVAARARDLIRARGFMVTELDEG